MSPLAAKLLNVALYQAGWFCCVLGAAWDYPISGALVALLLIGIHLLLARSRRSEALLMLGACLLGVVVDSTQQAFGVFTFKIDPSWPLWLPLWVFVIWAQFATLFRYALHWLAGRYWLAALFGMIGGPAAYVGGIRLGAASFGENPAMSITILAIVWTLVTPILLWVSDRLIHQEGSYWWFGSK